MQLKIMNLKSKQQNASDKRKNEIQEKLATGQITIAEAVGISKKQLYAIARRGYQLLNSGRLEEARQIYAGLVAADPYDSVFHCHLGAVLWRMGEIEKARAEYDASLRYNIANVDALAGRGELYLLNGEIKQGVELLRKSVELDPKGERPSSVRARALLLSLCQAAQKAALQQ
jgi:Flp pilus assembly protein TadD